MGFVHMLRSVSLEAAAFFLCVFSEVLKYAIYRLASAVNDSNLFCFSTQFSFCFVDAACLCVASANLARGPCKQP